MARKNKFQHYEFEVTVSRGHVLPCSILFLLDQCVISQQACCSFPCGAGWGGGGAEFPLEINTRLRLVSFCLKANAKRPKAMMRYFMQVV